MPDHRVTIFGGSFDPPHLGHLGVAREMLARGLTDAVWLMPCGDHPFGRHLTPAEHRLAMLRLVAEFGMDVTDYEARKPGASYSIETLRHCARAFPDTAFSWLIGSDLLPGFSRWKDADTLTREFPVFVYPRAGHPFHPLAPGMRPLRELPEITASSTAARERMARGEDTADVLDPRIRSYIDAHHLYTPAR